MQGPSHWRATEAERRIERSLERRSATSGVWLTDPEDGLGDYLLHVFDEVSTVTAPSKTARNAGVKNPYDFVLRKAPGGEAFPLERSKGKVIVLNFWATLVRPVPRT